MSKESCLSVSRNLLYHMAGDLPPLTIMGRAVVTSRGGITVKPVYCIHLLIHSTSTCECLLQADALLGVEDAMKNKRESAPTSWSL